MGVQRELRAGRERMKERENNFKIESNLRKSWQRAESVIVACARQETSLLPFFFLSPSPFRIPSAENRRSGALLRVQFGLACSRNRSRRMISNLGDRRSKIIGGRAGNAVGAQTVGEQRAATRRDDDVTSDTPREDCAAEAVSDLQARRCRPSGRPFFFLEVKQN